MTGNHMIDGDDGLHPFSPFYLDRNWQMRLSEPHSKCNHCEVFFRDSELTNTSGGAACQECFKELKMTYDMSNAISEIKPLLPEFTSFYPIGNTAIVCGAYGPRKKYRMYKHTLDKIICILKSHGYTYQNHREVFDKARIHELHFDVIHKNTDSFHRPLY